jgi:hypothetical protein
VVVALVALGVPALIAILGYLVAPGVIKRQLEARLGAELGRVTTVEAVKVRPFSLEARIEGLTVAGAKAPLLTVEAIDVDASIASLWHRAPIVDALRITRPVLSFARVSPNRYDVSDLVDRALAPAEADAEPARYSLNNIEVLDGTVDFDDAPMRRRHRIDGLALGIPFLSSLPYAAEIKVTPRLAAQVNGSPLELTGAMTPYAERPEATLDVHLDELPVERYVAYLPVELRHAVAAGALSTRLKVAFAQTDAAAHRITVAGEASLAGLQVRRGDGQPLLAAGRAVVVIDHLDVTAREARLAKVDVEGVELVVRRLADGRI